MTTEQKIIKVKVDVLELSGTALNTSLLTFRPFLFESIR